MYIVSSLIFAFSVNIDAFFVGISYGVRKIRVPLLQNLALSLISFMGTLLSLLLGRQLLLLLPAFLADCLGSAILSLLGIYYIVKALPRSKGDLHSESLRIRLSAKEVLLLGIALSLNNIGIGIGMGISGVMPLPAAAAVFVISFLLLLSGNHLGRSSLFRLPERCADLLSGILLLRLGLCGYLL